MAKSCEFCGELRASIYCKADSANLCLSCDAKVHSANALSKRHFRTLLCEGCGNQPALVRCLDHQLFICHGCDQNMHEASVQHQKRMVSSYMGCPSARDFATLWGYDLKDCGSSRWIVCNSFGSVVFSVDNVETSGEFRPWMKSSTSTSELNSMARVSGVATGEGLSNLKNKILDKHQQVDHSILQQIIDLERLQLTETSNQSSMVHEQVQSEVYSTEANSSGQLGQGQCCRHTQGLDIGPQQLGTVHHDLQCPYLPLSQSEQLNASPNDGNPLNGDSFWQCRSPAQNSQLWSQNLQDLGICEDIDCYDGLKIPDVDLTFQNYEELFGSDQDQTRSIFYDMDAACSSMKKYASLCKLDNGYSRFIEDMAVDSSVHRIPSSRDEREVEPSDQVHQFTGSLDTLYPVQTTYSSLSFSLSRFSSETNASDYLDSGISPAITQGDPPWNLADQEDPHSKASRNAMIRYKEKK